MATLAHKLDRVFSLYIRTRHADRHTGMVHCYTCPRVLHWRDADCGHFERRGHWKLRYNPNNARPQCRTCNRHSGGKYEVFGQELREEIGDEAVLALQKEKYDDALYDDDFYRKQIAHFTNLNSTLYAP